MTKAQHREIEDTMFVGSFHQRDQQDLPSRSECFTKASADPTGPNGFHVMAVARGPHVVLQASNRTSEVRSSSLAFEMCANVGIVGPLLAGFSLPLVDMREDGLAVMVTDSPHRQVRIVSVQS